MSNAIMTHGYEIDWDVILDNPHYLLATVMGERVRIPVARSTIYAIQRVGEELGVAVDEHSHGADWSIPIGEAITRQIYMEKAQVVK